MTKPNDRVVPINTLQKGGGRCPLCEKPSDPRNRPFCSKRCADLDLSRWLHGVYRVPTDEAPEGSGGEDEGA
ncbi:MAG: DNA gyrase inhibitor YacG [Kiloniellales bacterium]|nr:DNA gyrase inhibitor YacG [Kiloniellales bacterium]